nr:hypothetical protein L204_01827 [Cryptococcus depauperatus CBS 7855]
MFSSYPNSGPLVAQSGGQLQQTDQRHIQGQDSQAPLSLYSSNSLQQYDPQSQTAKHATSAAYTQHGNMMPYASQSFGQPQNASNQIGHSGIPIPQPLSSYTSSQTFPGYEKYLPPIQLAHPVEAVIKDEDEVYGPLKRTRNKVNQCLSEDLYISPSLDESLNEAEKTDPYVISQRSAQVHDYCDITKRTPLPDALHQELSRKNLTARMGLFSEIERAWFTIDNKLFLWDYVDGHNFSKYDGQSDAIQTVGLVKARSDVFVDDIHYVLVICTSTKATLLGLSLSDPRNISLYQADMSIDTPTVLVDIKGTNEGRIFLLGLDKNLYELTYSSNSSWFLGSSTSLSLKNRTGGGVSSWMPSIATSKGQSGIESMAVDARQNRLYLLHVGGEVMLYDVASTRFDLKSSYKRLVDDLKRFSHADGVKAVKIVAVDSHESKRVCLVAIASNGVRVYFAIGPPFIPIIYRQPPPLRPGLSVSDQSIYSSSTFFAVQYDSGVSPAQTHLTVTLPQLGRRSALRENHETLSAPVFQECVISQIVPGQIWGIVELAENDPKNYPSYLTRPDGVVLNALATQTDVSPRKYLVLATSGLLCVEQCRPVDMFKADIEVGKDVVIDTTRMMYGQTQVAAMALQLCSMPDQRPLDFSSSLSIVLLTSGKPATREGTGGRIIVYSARHNGLALVTARFLRPIWDAKIITQSTNGIQQLGVQESVLNSVQSRLSQLRQFLEDHPFQRYQVADEDRVAWDQENLSIQGLLSLIKRTLEVISFLLLLSDYKITEVITRCDTTIKNVLTTMTFAELITDLTGNNVAQQLMSVLIEQQIGQQLGVDALSQILRERCGSFIRPGDVVQYKAEEHMRLAETCRDASEKRKMLIESLRLLRTAGSIPISRLQEVCHRYSVLDYNIGAIQLALYTAKNVDPNNKAVDFVHEGKHPADPRKALFDMRNECYQEVIKALKAADDQLDSAVSDGDVTGATQTRNEIYTLAVNSDDELFHYYLYDWHVQRGLQEQLLQFDTPYIENYLKLNTNNNEDRRDLLWKFFVRRQWYQPATEALYKLAVRPSPMALHDRLYYLAQALTCAQSASSLGSDNLDYTPRLQEQMDVAQLQMEIIHAIEARSEISTKDKSEILETLDNWLLPLDELYQNYACPLRLYESILSILKTSDTRLDHVCEAVWKELLEDAYRKGGAVGVGEAVRRLGNKYIPSEAAPLDIIVPLVYEEAVRCPQPAGWASMALLDTSISLRDLWEIVSKLYENSDDSKREFFAEQMSFMTQKSAE